MLFRSREHAEYITRVDSFHSPTRPSLWRMFITFFVMPYRAPVINTLVTLLGAISGVVSLVKRRQTVLIAAAAFAPFCVVALLYLDHFSASRFSIGYAPLIALLVADGAYLVARRWEVVLSGIIVAMMIIWTWPALVVARTTVSPPVAAVDWMRNHIDRHSASVYVDDGMIPFAKRYLPDYRTRYIDTAQPPPTWTEHEPGYYLQESASPSPNAENFIRAPGRLWSLVRQRYFDVSVRPISELVVFDNGWYEEEGEGGAVWRWMGARSVAILPPLNGEARLTLAMYFPLDALRTTPNVTIRINGALVDSFQAKMKSLEREIVVRARADGNNELLIATDRVVNPAAEHLGADARTLGLRLNSITWMPAQ